MHSPKRAWGDDGPPGMPGRPGKRSWDPDSSDSDGENNFDPGLVESSDDDSDDPEGGTPQSYTDQVI